MLKLFSFEANVSPDEVASQWAEQEAFGPPIVFVTSQLQSFLKYILSSVPDSQLFEYNSKMLFKFKYLYIHPSGESTTRTFKNTIFISVFFLELV